MKHLLNTISILIILSLAQGCFAQYIPVKVEVSQEQVRVNGELYYLHKVSQRQTLYSISKAYGIPADSIIEDNPKITSGLKEGELIYIRVNGTQPFNEEVETSTDPQEIQATHTVRWYETLSSIAKKYDVSEEDIALLNNLVNNKIKVREKLKIPYKGYAKSNPAEIAPDKPTKDIFDQEKEEAEEETIFDRRKGMYQKINAKLLLPLGGKHNGEQVLPQENNHFMEFYQGFLLALEELKESNPTLELDLEVIDTDSYPNISHITQSGMLDNSNIIFGPVFSENLELVVNYTKGKDIYVVSPMDPKSDYLAYGNPHFFQVSTPATYQQRGILSAINFMSDVTLVYEERDTGTDQIANITKEVLNSGNIRYKQLSYNILKGRSILPEFESTLSTGNINHVVVASNSEAFVSDVLRNLNLLRSRSQFNIKVYGTPQWRNFESVDVAYYHQMNLNISMQYYIDYSREQTKGFLAKFRALYNSEPSPYAFQAYDIAYYFLHNTWNEGKLFLENANHFQSEMLQSDYNFVRDGKNNGYINTAVRRVIYKPDFSTSDIRGFFR